MVGEMNCSHACEGWPTLVLRWRFGAREYEVVCLGCRRVFREGDKMEDAWPPAWFGWEAK